MNIRAFINLIRFNNLVVIALTMLVTRYCMIQPILAVRHPDMQLQLSHADFFLLILSTLLIAAAGYIINDYFDVKTDRINKPEKLYIDNGVKRRLAIVIHTVFNVLGFAIGVYVAHKANNVFLCGIQFVSITALWFYSTHLKRQVLNGNILVAALSALVPLLVLFFEMPLLEHKFLESIKSFSFLYLSVCSFALFAFLLSLVREIIKDIEDLKGDYETGCRTMPIVWGVKAAKAIVAGLISNILLLQLFIFYKLYKQHFSILLIYLFVFVFGPLVFLIWKLYRSQQKQEYHTLSRWVKYIMLTGVLSTIIIYLTCYGYI
ncbi:MAG TPA: geranylgeranylglycerol-phosphate geranylgeranyltransferase [Bacteroidia bacterium]|jgi:4-hydroxybenzoate polyprenyltransferase|nr:geranylgeranylglycerol-phosphate geranylgeranyltransferase [Bacteroidia bacterium]